MRLVTKTQTLTISRRMPEFDFDLALMLGNDAGQNIAIEEPNWNPTPIAELLNGKSRTFFYPGAGLDFQPCCRLTHLFDRFIFCDVSVSEADFCSAMHNISNWSSSRRCNRPTGGLELVKLRRLSPGMIPQDRECRELLRRIEMSPDEHFRYWRCHDEWQTGPKWGMAATLKRRIGNSHRRITLFYLGTEATATYLKLYSLRNTAPTAVCIRTYFQDLGITDWRDLLGRAVRMSARKPDMIFGGGSGLRGERHPSTWPWRIHWQNFGSGWKEFANVASPLPTLVPQAFSGTRHIRLVPERLTPTNVDSAQAVVIGRGFNGFQWPPGLKIISLGSILDTERGDYATEDEVAIQPMDAALQKLDEICRTHGIERVAAVPFGFEDEGQVLTEWRAVDGWPKEITFFCPTPGDFHSLGGSF